MLFGDGDVSTHVRPPHTRCRSAPTRVRHPNKLARRVYGTHPTGVPSPTTPNSRFFFFPPILTGYSRFVNDFGRTIDTILLYRAGPGIAKRVRGVMLLCYNQRLNNINIILRKFYYKKKSLARFHILPAYKQHIVIIINLRYNRKRF